MRPWSGDSNKEFCKSALRRIFGTKRNAEITLYIKELSWLCIDSPRDYFALHKIYRIMDVKKPQLLLPLFKRFYLESSTRGSCKDTEIPAVSAD